MKVYTDVFSGDEIVSDSFEINLIYDGVGGEVHSKLLTKGGVDVDIGCGNAFAQQKPADDGEEHEKVEEVEDKEEKVNNVLDAFHYQTTPFTKAEYTSYFKGYIKRVKEHLDKNKPERVPGFMKGAQEMFKWILTNFADFEFYCPESYDNDNIIILSYYKGEATAPTFVYFMDGLKEIKF